MTLKRLHKIDHIYFICDKTYELNRYNFLLNWAKLHFEPNYYSFKFTCYKDTISEKNIQRYKIKEDRLKPSEVSLFINHMKILEEFYDKFSSNSNCIIFESDIIPQENWDIIINKQMDLIEDDFDFLHIGNGGNDTFLPTVFDHVISDDINVYKCPSGRCAEAIIWSHTGAGKYLSYKNEPVVYPFDFYLNRIAAYGVETLDEVKTYWGHPVAFIQGSASGKYKSSVNDDIIIQKRLTHYSKRINLKIDKPLRHYAVFIKKLLQKKYPDVLITFFTQKKHNLYITNSIMNIQETIDNKITPHIIINEDPSKIPSKYGELLRISTRNCFDNIYVPPIFLNERFLFELDKLKYRVFDDKKYDYWFDIYETNNKSFGYLTNNLKKHEKYSNGNGINSNNGRSLFTLCIEDEYFPGNVTEKILNAYFNGSIPVYWGCNITVNKIFNKNTFINISNFVNEKACYKYLIEMCKNKNLLISFFEESCINPNFDLDKILKDLSNNIKYDNIY